MSSTTHTYELQTKDFGFVVVTDTRPRTLYAQPECVERARAATKPNSSFDAAALNTFHEEFKSLVLAADEQPEAKIQAEIFDELFALIELEWSDVPQEAVSNHPSPVVAPPATVKAAPPKQVVRPIAAPRVGTPMPIETWVVKVIVVLVGLNLIFASLIVTGTRVSDLFK